MAEGTTEGLKDAIRVDGEQLRGHVDQVVRSSVEETLNGLLQRKPARPARRLDRAVAAANACEQGGSCGRQQNCAQCLGHLQPSGCHLSEDGAELGLTRRFFLLLLSGVDFPPYRGHAGASRRSPFKGLGADAAQVTVAADSIVEHLDVVEDVGARMDATRVGGFSPGENYAGAVAVTSMCAALGAIDWVSKLRPFAGTER